MIRKRLPTHRTNGVSIDRALTDRKLLGAALGDDESWSRWLAVLRAAFALPMVINDRKLFRAVAGDRKPPRHRVDELWCVIGRRSGKSRIAAAIATYLGAFGEHKLAPGELGFVLVLAKSRDQAQVVFGYILAFLQSSPVLASEIVNTTASEIRLRNNVVIAVTANSFRTVRGKTLLACIFDEVSFWRDEISALPDLETYRAVIPALMTTGGMLIGISTGYRRTGLLYNKHRDHFGTDNNDVLVVQGDSRAFNPILSKASIDRAKLKDPEAAGSEWDGQFRDDLASFLDDATIDACIDRNRPLELPPRKSVKYIAFADPSGGRGDAFTLAIGHKDEDRYVCDAIRGVKAPFDPRVATQQLAALANDYGITKLIGDNYSAEWVTSAFKDHGITFENSKQSKSELYLEALPLFTRESVVLPDDKKLVRELRLLERQTSRSGRDTIDHPKRDHDDFANALCGMLATLATRPAYDQSLDWVDGPSSPESDREWRRQRFATYVCSGGLLR